MDGAAARRYPAGNQRHPPGRPAAGAAGGQPFAGRAVWPGPGGAGAADQGGRPVADRAADDHQAAPDRRLDDGAGPVSMPAGGIGSTASQPRVVSAHVSGSSPLDPYVSIILPCYNEQDHVVAEVERICAAMDTSGYGYEVVAYDDASTDETLARLHEAAPRFPHLQVVHFDRNGGAGTVRRVGTQRAQGEVVVWTDADMTYPNERIPELVQMLEKDPSLDQVVGARTTEEGSHKILRVPAKWFIRKLAERLTNTKIPDLNSGLRAFRRQVALPYLRLLPPGFSCVTTITIAFLSNQHDVRYVPIEYPKRWGTPKFHFVSDAYGTTPQIR